MTSLPVAPRPQARRPEIVILVGVSVLVAFYYFARIDVIGVYSPWRGWSPMTAAPVPSAVHFGVAALVLGVVPVVIVRSYTGMTFSELGLGLGNRRLGIALLAVGLPLAVLAGFIGAASPEVRAVYPLDLPAESANFLGYAVMQFLYFGAWEVLFRGVLLFGLRPQLGDGVANSVQTALSVTAHFGRAFNETFAALPAGMLFGWFTLRIGSVWYVAVIHWMVGISLDWFISR